MIDKVTDTLWVSGDPMYSEDLKEDIKLLKKADVIIDLREETDGNGWIDLYKTNHIKVDMSDDGIGVNTPEHFHDVLWQLMDFAQFMKVDALEPNILIHCHMGVNRSPSVAMFLLMTLADMEPQEAFEAIRKARSVAAVSYASEAVQAWIDLNPSSEADADDYTIQLWKSYEKVYWQQHADEDRAITQWVKARHRQGEMWTDSQGRIHATAAKKGVK